MMLAKFREYYPQGSLVSKLVKIDRGIYIVKVAIKVENIILATALAGGDTVEKAEDAARVRAIATLVLEPQAVDWKPKPEITKQISPVNSSHSNPIPKPTSTRKQTANSSANKGNIVNLYEPETNSASNLESTIASANSQPTVPTIIPEPSAPEPLIEPEIDSQNSDSVVQPGNLFAGTSSPANIEQSPSPQSSKIEEESTAEETTVATINDFDFTQVKQKTDIEIERLGWTRDDGREFLQSRYGKRSRLHLKDNELLEFLHYLEKLPTPIN